MAAYLSKAERNKRIRGLMNELLNEAATGKFEIDQAACLKLQQVCRTTTRGFREILLVIGIARLLDPQYAPTKRFYDCNPRAIYEGPIREALWKAGIPHGKSGPLNIAKAQAGINEVWAAQRRPPGIASIVVGLTQEMENSSASRVRNLTVGLLAELLRIAEEAASYAIQVPQEANIAYLTDICSRMINQVPDAGNTPQYIVGLLLETYHEDIGSLIKVSGHEQRASTTSTTSKKPGDIMEQSPNGQVLAVYEVTVKPFDEQRAEDSHEAVQEFAELVGQTISEVVVICRENDVHPHAQMIQNGTLHMATLTFRNLEYQFLQIHRWICSALCRLRPDARVRFYKRLNDYVSNPNTPEKVKQFWKQLHKKGLI